MSRAIALNRRIIAFLIMLVIGATLIVYFFYPAGTPQKQVTYAYSVTVYDLVGRNLNIPAKNITVVLQGITFKDYNVSLNAPNLKNTTYYFENLKAGDYKLSIYSTNYQILLYNKTFTLNRDIIEDIVIPAQPLTVSVLIDNKPSKFSYDIIIKNLDKGFNITGKINPQSTFYIPELALGNYTFSLKYLGLEINKTTIALRGNQTTLTFNTNVVNATFKLLDTKGRVLNDTSLYLVYQKTSIGPYLSSKSGVIDVTNVPPFVYEVVFSYKGTNVTLKEAPIADLSKNNGSFNFTTYLGNLTIKVKYDDNTPARGLHVGITPLVGAVLGVEGNATFYDIPANKDLNIEVDAATLIALRQTISIQPDKNNTIELIIHKYNLTINLVGKSDLSNFNIFSLIQSNFNKSIVIRQEGSNINLQLYPAVYHILAYVDTPSKIPKLIYEEYIGLNQSISKSVNVTLGYSISVKTSSSNDEISLYYIDTTGSYLVDKKPGNEALFTNLVSGNYKIAVFRGGKYVASSYVVLDKNSPQLIQISIDTSPTNPILQSFQYGIALLLILLIVLITLSYLIFRVYKRRKEAK